MALGRHRAEPPTHSAGQNLPSDFPLWSAFITAAACSSMVVFGMSAAVNVMITAVLALGFVLVWWLAFSAGRALSPSPVPVPVPARVPGAESEPAPKLETTGTEAARPSSPRQGASCNGFEDGDRAPRTADPDSRWIDTFGPPETGQLPIQRYVERMRPGTSVGVPSESAPPPQWSHSRA